MATPLDDRARTSRAVNQRFFTHGVSRSLGLMMTAQAEGQIRRCFETPEQQLY